MALLMILLAVFAPFQGHHDQTTRRIKGSEVAAVIQAVQDEIYDYGFEDDYSQVGENPARRGSARISRMPIYIDPSVKNGEGRVIYHAAHYGEVFREFFIREDGIVVLDGDPGLGFPPTQPSHRTAYMEGTSVRRMKRDWLKRFFRIDMSPSSRTIRAAADRQIRRTGFSYWKSVILSNQKKL
jgi:hypothetical protein